MYIGVVLDGNKKIMNFYQDDLGYLLQNFRLVENMKIKENTDLYVDHVGDEQIAKLLNEGVTSERIKLKVMYYNKWYV